MLEVQKVPQVFHLLFLASFFFGDSSHSFPCKEGGNTNPVPEVPREVSASPIGNENGAPGALVMCPDNSRKNPNMLRLVTSTRTARVTNAAGEKLTSPRFPRNE